MRVLHAWGTHIALEVDGVERLRYNYQLAGDPSPSAPKPFCHPIRTPDGVEITVDAPIDHFWHRGLWFTWKFVNGVNYWEERQEVVGRQITLAPPTVAAVDDDPEAVRWTSDIAWRDTRDGAETTRIRERRAITCRFKPEGALVMDWDVAQTAQEAVTLDRTPFTTWGGYGGLFIRMTQALHKQSIVFSGGVECDRPTGQNYLWGGIQGQLDTGRGRHAAFVFLPSPKNRRAPEPFYGSARAFSNFFGPAPLFHEPLALAQGETLRQAYRVLILPRRIEAAEAEGYYQDWVKDQPTE